MIRGQSTRRREVSAQWGAKARRWGGMFVMASPLHPSCEPSTIGLAGGRPFVATTLAHRAKIVLGSPPA